MKAVLSLSVVLCVGCATVSGPATIDARFQKVPAPKLHKKPLPRESTGAWHALQQTTFRPLAESLNPGYWILQATGGHPALDVNDFEEVIDSAWFENRLTRRDLRPQDFARGPNQTPPAPGRLAVLGGKTEGATPGLLVQDTAGQRFLIKFDPPAYPELSSGAEIISARVLWAAGYNVPENYVLTFDLSRLQLEEGATTAGRFGKEVPLTQKKLQNLIALVNPFPDGKVRALFSKLIPGEGVGPFDYRGSRHDDPNDRIPHERRRSLRGLGLISAWINNVDTREANTFDAFIESPDNPGLGYLQHYLLDFGDALGSAGTKPKYLGLGYEGLIDWPIIGRSLASFGIWYRRWLPLKRSSFRSVGVFESQVFNPKAWRPALPNPAFEAAEPLDRYWAASVIARFDVDDLLAIIEQAEYSDPRAAAWVLRVMLQRQLKILEWSFSEVLPLDRLRITDHLVRMEDLAVRAGLYAADEAGYQYEIQSDGQLVAQGENYVPEVDLSSLFSKAVATDLEQDVTIIWRRVFPTEHPSSLKVKLRLGPKGIVPIGLSREVN